MAEKVQIELAKAQDLAAEASLLFGGTFTKLLVAGSIRRQKAMVGDIELLGIPAYGEEPDGLFDAKEVNLQFARAKELRAQGLLADRLASNGNACFGESFQRVLFKGFALDVFCCTAKQWGVSLLIRTGCADFSHRAVMPRNQQLRGKDGNYRRGLLKPDQSVKGWRLLELGRPLETETEGDFFRLTGNPWLEPEERVA